LTPDSGVFFFSLSGSKTKRCPWLCLVPLFPSLPPPPSPPDKDKRFCFRENNLLCANPFFSPFKLFLPHPRYSFGGFWVFPLKVQDSQAPPPSRDSRPLTSCLVALRYFLPNLPYFYFPITVPQFKILVLFPREFERLHPPPPNFLEFTPWPVVLQNSTFFVGSPAQLVSSSDGRANLPSLRLKIVFFSSPTSPNFSPSCLRLQILEERQSRRIVFFSCQDYNVSFLCMSSGRLLSFFLQVGFVALFPQLRETFTLFSDQPSLWSHESSWFLL